MCKKRFRVWGRRTKIWVFFFFFNNADDFKKNDNVELFFFFNNADDLKKNDDVDWKIKIIF